MSRKVFLCGEGKTELGSRIGHPSFQSDDAPGVLAALVASVAGAFRVVGALEWKRLRKYRAHGPTPRFAPDEAEQVAKLLLAAAEHGADVVVFSRDADNQHVERAAAILRGKERGRELAVGVEVVGEIAAPCIEGWILALHGASKTEQMTRDAVDRELDVRAIARRTEHYVRLIEARGLDEVQPDAAGLRAWLAAARVAVPRDDASNPAP